MQLQGPLVSIVFLLVSKKRPFKQQKQKKYRNTSNSIEKM